MNRLKAYFIGDKWIWGIILLLMIYPLPSTFLGISDIKESVETIKLETENQSLVPSIAIPLVKVLHKPIKKHLAYLFLSLCLMVIFSWLTYTKMKGKTPPKMSKSLWIALLLSWGLILITIFFGEARNQASRWISFFGIFTFQPSEISKLIVILYVAYNLHRNQRNDSGPTKLDVWKMLTFTFITGLLIIGDSFSMAILIFASVFVIMFAGRANKQILMTLVGSALLLAVLAIGFGEHIGFLSKRAGTRRSRIINFYPRMAERISAVNFIDHSPPNVQAEGQDSSILSTEVSPIIEDRLDELDYRHNVIVETSFWGMDPGEYSHIYKIKERNSDYVLTLIMASQGYFGMIVISLLFLCILFRTLSIIKYAKNALTVLLGVAMSIAVVTQAFMHIGVNCLIFPPTGQNLPFISTGGSSMLTHAIGVSILLAMTQIAKDDRKAKEQAELNKAESVAGLAATE